MQKECNNEIKVGDNVILNKNHPANIQNQKYGKQFKVIDIKPHKGISGGIGYRIKRTERKYKGLGAFYVSKKAILKI